MRRLSRAGFTKDFASTAILPDWWDSTCKGDPALLPEVEIRVARFLGVPLSVIRDPTAALTPPLCAGVQLRRVRDLQRDRLAPAIHAAMRIASAVVRNLIAKSGQLRLPPADGLAWREEIVRQGPAVTLNDMLSDLWQRGIPIVPVSTLPAPSFQGLACVVDGRPVVVLGHRYDHPGRVAFLVGHEVGHIAAGHCSADHPVVDEDEGIEDDSALERAADQYATRVLVGQDVVPAIEASGYKGLATASAKLEKDAGVDAGVAAFAWARRTGDYVTATMAVKALYRASGARRTLLRHFDTAVPVESSPESDRVLLQCVTGERERDAATD